MYQDMNCGSKIVSRVTEFVWFLNELKEASGTGGDNLRLYRVYRNV
jgi:hypothetical protein